MKKYISILIVLTWLGSCTKEIDLKLNNASPQLVIEGHITDEEGPYFVKLSRTVGFGESNVYPAVSRALVYIYDNIGTIDTLSETTPGLYRTHRIKGKPGNTYTLKVIVEGKQYDAVSTMPEKVNLDGIQFDAFNEPGESNTFAIVPLYFDPLEWGNNYRFFFSANGVADKSYQVSNDNIGNGSVNQQPFFNNDVKFYKGDTVKVTMLCIDVNTYNYYYTLSQIAESGPGGGAAPSNPPNNITGNKALGIFSAATTQTRTAVIP